MLALASGFLDPFDAKERIAVQVANEMMEDGHGLTDETAEAARAEYGDAGLVEIVAVAGLFHYFNRLNNALRVEVTK